MGETKKKPGKGESPTPDEERFNETLKRLLKTPPKPKSNAQSGKKISPEDKPKR